ncbi:MAG TPA: hypothetical protein PK788_06240 [Gemmatimonadaceae bacterium]|nr:hypothetical protein [Gemmatimonadaceae bacterium]
MPTRSELRRAIAALLAIGASAFAATTFAAAPLAAQDTGLPMGTPGPAASVETGRRRTSAAWSAAASRR